MSDSPLVCYTKLSPNCSARTRAIDTVTVHCMAGNATIESCGDLFSRKSTGASSNYGIGSDGRIALYVPESKRSWCSSNTANDNRAVTIEVANSAGAPDWPVTDKAYNALVELLADICYRNGIKKLVWSTDKSQRVNHVNGCNMTIHRDYAAKSCPGDYLYNLHGKIADEVNERLEELNMVRYQTYDDIPDWGKETVRNLIVTGKLNGTSGSKDSHGYPTGLDLSSDMLRILVMLNR